MKRRIRLTESDLHKIVNMAVKRVLREADNPLEYCNTKDWSNREFVDDSAYDDDDDTYGRAARNNYMKDWE